MGCPMGRRPTRAWLWRGGALPACETCLSLRRVLFRALRGLVCLVLHCGFPAPSTEEDSRLSAKHEHRTGVVGRQAGGQHEGWELASGRDTLTRSLGSCRVTRMMLYTYQVCRILDVTGARAVLGSLRRESLRKRQTVKIRHTQGEREKKKNNVS